MPRTRFCGAGCEFHQPYSSPSQGALCNVQTIYPYIAALFLSLPVLNCLRPLPHLDPSSFSRPPQPSTLTLTLTDTVGCGLSVTCQDSHYLHASAEAPYTANHAQAITRAKQGPEQDGNNMESERHIKSNTGRKSPGQYLVSFPGPSAESKPCLNILKYQ